MQEKMLTYLQWKVCNAFYVCHFSIPTSSQALTKHNHPCIGVHLVHICNIYRTYLFDRILPNIDKHGIQPWNQFLFLLKKERNMFWAFEGNLLEISVLDNGAIKWIPHVINKIIFQSYEETMKQVRAVLTLQNGTGWFRQVKRRQWALSSSNSFIKHFAKSDKTTVLLLMLKI